MPKGACCALSGSLQWMAPQGLHPTTKAVGSRTDAKKDAAQLPAEGPDLRYFRPFFTRHRSDVNWMIGGDNPEDWHTPTSAPAQCRNPAEEGRHHLGKGGYVCLFVQRPGHPRACELWDSLLSFPLWRKLVATAHKLC